MNMENTAPDGATPVWANEEVMSTEGTSTAKQPEDQQAAPVYVNKALMIGTQTPAFDAVLKREVEVLFGSMYGARDKRNTQDGA